MGTRVNERNRPIAEAVLDASKEPGRPAFTEEKGKYRYQIQAAPGNGVDK